PYAWPEESLVDVPLAALPAIGEDQAQAFADEAAALVPAHLRPARLADRSRRRPAAPAGDLRGTRAAVTAALAFIPNADLAYDDWVRIGMALKGALGEDGTDLFAAWSAQSAKNVPETTARAWASFRPTAIGAGTLYHLAIERGWRPDPSLVLNGTIPHDGVHPAAPMLAKIESPASAAYPLQPKAPPPEVFKLDGALALFVDYIVGSAIRPQPWLAIGASLAALGTLIGRRYCTTTNLRSNLYVVCSAASGGGKDHARNCISQAFIAAGLASHLGGNRIASGSGLLAALYRNPASLFQLDEFGQFMAQIVDKRRAPKYLSEIWDLLTELYTSAGSTFLGSEYGNQKERPREDIVQPCCCIHATTVPEPMWAALRHASLYDGSLARFLLFHSPDSIPDRNRAPRPIGDVPPELLDALRAIVAGVPDRAGNLAVIDAPAIRPNPYPVPTHPEADDLLIALDLEVTAEQRRAIGTGREAVLARVWENTAKVALIKAVSANPAAPAITRQDAEWAKRVVTHCVDTLLAQAERHIADNETERNHKRVLDIIRQGGQRGLTKKQLYDRTRFLSRRDREDILTTLIESEQIDLDVRKTATKPVIVFRAVAP
ncbi:MAG: PriCT-2 domain-containing protein, partial [Rhodospirillaceae bacterium]|nr:PriCT-2 domain-containing protein [Rhodospirillaceae bacterium]